MGKMWEIGFLVCLMNLKVCPSENISREIGFLVCLRNLKVCPYENISRKGGGGYLSMSNSGCVMVSVLCFGLTYGVGIQV